MRRDAGDAASDADPDAVWLSAAAAGDEQAFARLVDRHLPRLHALAWRALGTRPDAEDVVQETLLRAWRQLPQWRSGEARFSTWLQRVVLNLVTDRLRQRRAHQPLDEVQPTEPGPGPERTIEAGQRDEAVRAALSSLPERQRDALLLCHFEGLGNAETAATLGVGVEAVESLLARGRRRLRELLDPDLPGTEEP